MFNIKCDLLCLVHVFVYILNRRVYCSFYIPCRIRIACRGHNVLVDGKACLIWYCLKARQLHFFASCEKYKNEFDKKMQTGFDMVETGEANIPEDFLKSVIGVLRVLFEDSMMSAQRFAKVCGRTQVTGRDMYFALMYEAHEFFDRDDLETRFLKQSAVESDDEEDEAESSEEDEEVTEAYSTDCVVPDDQGFHKAVMMYAQQWETWMPEDPMKQMLKRAIDDTAQRLPEMMPI